MRLVVPIEMLDMKGGMLQSVELMLRHLASSIEKIVFIPGASSVGQRMEAAGARIVKSRQGFWTVDRNQPLATGNTFRVFRQEIRALLSDNTLILTNNLAAELLCGLGSPFPATPRVFVNRGDAYRGLSGWALRKSIRTCRRCVATTTYQKETLENTLGVESERITLIPNSVDFDLLALANSHAKPQWHRPGRVHVATLGYPSVRKNQELLIRSIAALAPDHPEAVGVIVGSPGCETDEEYLSFLRRLAAELCAPDSILFVPFTANTLEVFSGIDILASTALREGFGRTIVEAMAASRPVVAKRAGGPETLIEDGRTGLLVSGTEASVFAGAIRRLIETPGLGAELAGNALSNSRARFAPAAVSQQYEDLVRACV